MAVREFNGTSDQIVLGGGSLGAFVNAALTILLVVKPTTAPTAADTPIGIQNSSTLLVALSEVDSNRLAWYSATEDVRAFMTAVDTTWQVFAVTKASGTVTPRFHRKQLGAGSWDHVDGGATVANNATSVNRIEIGSIQNAQFTDCRMACAALFATALSDANIDSVQTTPSTQKLADLGAVALWDFNQASTGTAVSDLVGTASQTAISGTTVVTGDDPPGWTFGLAGPPAVGRNRSRRIALF